MNAKSKIRAKKERQLRVRKKVSGTAERPRLCVFRSLKYIYAQLVNDEEGKTLAAASNNEAEMKQKSFGSKTEAATEVGRLLAERAKKVGVEKVVFDRAGYLYHGRVKAVAEGAREGGLQL